MLSKDDYVDLENASSDEEFDPDDESNAFLASGSEIFRYNFVRTLIEMCRGEEGEGDDDDEDEPRGVPIPKTATKGNIGVKNYLPLNSFLLHFFLPFQPRCSSSHSTLFAEFYEPRTSLTHLLEKVQFAASSNLS